MTWLFHLTVALVVVFFIGGCATTPSMDTANVAAVAAGHQRLHIETIRWVVNSPDFPGMREQKWLERRDGAKCTARNDKGSWETITPGTVDVATGDGPLTVECAMAGYQVARRELSCTTPRTRSTLSGAMTGLQLAAGLGPAAAFAAPAAVLAAMAGSTAVGAAAGNATAGPDADVCNYSAHGFIGSGNSARAVITIELPLEERR